MTLPAKIDKNRRSLDQNSMFHALCDQVSCTRMWAGRWLSKDHWKRLLIAAWCRTQGDQAEIFPALDGHGFDVVYIRSSKLTKAEMSELVTYAQWWIDEHKHSDPEPVSYDTAPRLAQRGSIVRSRKLLDAARGQSCINCDANDGTVVAAHYSGAFAHLLGRGAGQKPDDLFCAHLCHACHLRFDSYEDGNGEARSIRFLILCLLTIKRLWTMGVLKA